MDADLVVFDPEASFRVEASRLVYRHPVSPYLGEKLYGVVEGAFVRGNEVVREGVLAGSPLGMEVVSL
jgi:allantoinase